jgi:protein-tyrosine phosphatase
MEMIDLHCHLLPGIDDGPATLEEALGLCRMAVAGGTTRAIVTPHIHPGRWANTKKTIARDCALLQQALVRHDIPLQLGFAAEVRLTDRLMGQVEADEIPFLGLVDNYRIVLLEFPHGHVIPGSEKLVQWLLARGIRPLIAHPERNKQIMKDPAVLSGFIDLGCWLQVTAGSVLGEFGDRASGVARRLLEADQVAVLASDGHNARARKPLLREAYEHVSEHYGAARAQHLMYDNPKLIVATQFLSGLVEPWTSGDERTA